MHYSVHTMQIAVSLLLFMCFSSHGAAPAYNPKPHATELSQTIWSRLISPTLHVFKDSP